MDYTLKNKKVREVNSFHQYAIKTMPLDYNCLGKTKDGSIEHIEHKKLPWQGIMWHPEREEEFSQEDKTLIKKCLNLSS